MAEWSAVVLKTASIGYRNTVICGSPNRARNPLNLARIRTN
jgi:hypothetical protein